MINDLFFHLHREQTIKHFYIENFNFIHNHYHESNRLDSTNILLLWHKYVIIDSHEVWILKIELLNVSICHLFFCHFPIENKTHQSVIFRCIHLWFTNLHIWPKFENLNHPILLIHLWLLAIFIFESAMIKDEPPIHWFYKWLFLIIF